MSWVYFTVTFPRDEPFDPGSARFGRRDPAGRPHNCQMLQVDSQWHDDDLLERYYLLGSNYERLTDVTEEQAARLIDEAVRLGRFGGRSPAEPTVGCLLYTSPSPRDGLLSRMPSSA